MTNTIMINRHDDFVKLFDSKWIQQKIDKAGIDYAEDLGFFLCDKKKKETYLTDRPGRDALTNSQIRNVFGEVKRIQAKVSGQEQAWNEEEASFLLLRPKMAYAQARVVAKSRNSRITTFKAVMEKAHTYVTNVSEFENFASFFEAILAYHKAYGGKES